MTTAAKGVLRTLDRFLLANPKRRHALNALYLKHTGRELLDGALWKHRKQKVEPQLGTSLVYMIFLSKEGALISSPTPGALFTYQNPAWLKQ